VGCYDDRAATRSLDSQSVVNATGMTPALCIEFCSNFTFPYGFAGVEFGEECWCDGVIQLTANLTDSSACDIPCTGDNTLLCGGSNHISIYTDGTPSPKIPTVAGLRQPDSDAAVINIWEWVGCFSDSASNRTLQRSISQEGGTDINNCVAACADAFPDSAQIGTNTENSALFAGVEFGGECWCGTSISSMAQKLPDIACASMGCFGLNDQACGGRLVIAIYKLNPLLGVNECVSPNPFDAPFQLNAVFVDDPSTSVPITMTSLINHTNFGSTDQAAGTLSHCPTCSQSITFHLTSDSQWELVPTINAETALNNLTVSHPGGTTNFVEITDDDMLFVGYCVSRGTVNPEIPELIPFGKHVQTTTTQPLSPWALCINGTAGGRQDVVFKPLAFNDGYNLTGCNDVVLEMIFDGNVTLLDN